MPRAFTLPDGRMIDLDQAGSLLDSPDIKYGGLDKFSWMQFAADEIQAQQMARRDMGSGSLLATEQVAIQDAWRMRVGEQPVMAGRDFYQEAKQRSSTEHQMLGLSREASKRLAAKGAGAIELVAPTAGRRMRRTAEQVYGPKGEGLGPKIGGIIGETLGAVPALVSPIAGAIGMYGIPAAGEFRGDVAEKRREGQEISKAAEYLGALSEGAQQSLLGFVKVKIAGAMGKQLVGGMMPTLTKTLSKAGEVGLRKTTTEVAKVFVKGLPAFELGALAEGAEEFIQSLVSRGIRGMVYDPGQSWEQAIDQAWEEGKAGFGMAHVLAPVAGVLSLAPGGAMAAGVGVEAGPVQPISPPAPQVDQLQILKDFAKDPKIPEEVKEQAAVLAMEQAAETGVLTDAQAIIDTVMAPEPALEPEPSLEEVIRPEPGPEAVAPVPTGEAARIEAQEEAEQAGQAELDREIEATRAEIAATREQLKPTEIELAEAEMEAIERPVRPEPKKPAKPREKLAPEPVTEAQEKARAREKEAAEPVREPEPAPRAAPEVEKLFDLSIKRKLTMAEKKTLGRPQEHLAKLARNPSDTDSAVAYTATQMGLIKNMARRLIGQGADADMDEITQAGIAELQRSFTEPVKRGKYKGQMRAAVLAADPEINATTMLFGKGSLAWTAMKRTAFPLRGRPAAKGVPTLKPEVSLDAIAERQVEAAQAAEVEGKKRVDIEAAEFEPESEAVLVDRYAETAKQMKAEGKSDAEIMRFLGEQNDVHWLPDSESAVLAEFSGKPVSEKMKESLLSDDATSAISSLEKRLGRKLDLRIPVTEEEVAAQKFAEERGLELIFASNIPGGVTNINPRTGKTVIVMPSGRGAETLRNYASHEVWHGITKGKAELNITDKTFLGKMGRMYLEGMRKAGNRPGEEGKFFQKMHHHLLTNKTDLDIEAGAMVVGEVLTDPAARARLRTKAPNLFRQIWDNLKITIKRMAGVNPVVDEVIREFNRSTVEFLADNKAAAKPVRVWMPDSLESDQTEFTKDLEAVMKESPKVSGRPELANPMHTEGQRRLMDFLDEQDKVKGNPVKETENQWYRQAQKMLADPKQKRELSKKMEIGGMLSAPETVAAQQILRESGDKILAKPTLSNILDIQKKGMGWRRGGTETARAMRARHDKIRSPAERMKEFVIAGIAGVPSHIAKKTDSLTKKGKSAEADKLLKEHGERAARILAEWEKAGIDLTTLDDIAALSPRFQAKIMHDLQRLHHKSGLWDPIHEIRRNFLMYAPATFMRNMIGGAYAAADLFVTKPVARTIQMLAGIDTTGQTTAAWHAFASKTAVARGIQNMINTMLYEVPMLETEISLRTGTGPKGASQLEIHTPPSITGEALRTATEYATRIFSESPMAVLQAGRVAKGLGAILGHTVRVPQRLNSAVDQFVKTLHVHSEIAAHAVKLGKHLGLGVGSPEMIRFVEEQIQDLGSASWEAAVQSDESWRVTFQGEAGAFEQFILDASKQKGFGNFVRLLIPFRKTPVQLAGQSMMHLPGFGTARMAQRGIQHMMGSREYTSEEWSRHAAQQLIGMAGLAMVWNMAGEDDEDKLISITGPASYRRQERRERVTTQQIRPYMTIKYKGKNYNYNYVEPFSQWLGTLAAITEESKRYIKRGEEKPTKSAMRLWRRISGMYSDQTYIRTLGDLYKTFYDPDIYGQRLTVNFAGSWLPNFVDTSLRDMDPFIRERRIMGESGERATWTKQVMREMLPTNSIMPPPKVDFFGNDIKVAGSAKPTTMFVNRLLNPFTERTVLKGKQADVIQMLMNYNATKRLDDKKDPPVWFQEPGRQVSVRYPNIPKSIREDLNENEYYLYTKLSGMLAQTVIEKENWNVDNPTRRDIIKLETIFTKTRAAARKMVAAARQAKALNKMDEYDDIIERIKARIRDIEKGAP